MGEDKTKILKTLVILIAVVLGITALSGCIEDGGDDDGDTPTITTIEIDGSSTVFPIAQLCAEAFNAMYDNITVEIGSPPAGSGGGIRGVGEGQLDIGDASRPIKQSEIDEYPEVDFYENVIAYDGVAIIVSYDLYNHDTNPITNLTSEQVLGIYNGTYTNWNEVGGPDLEIDVNEREEGSGTRDTFMEAIFGSDDATADGADAAWTGNSEVQTAVATSTLENSIGYVGLGYIDDTSTPDLLLDDIEAKASTIADGSYPISRSLYMYTNGEPTGAIKTFIDYVQGPEGQQVVEDEGFIPL